MKHQPQAGAILMDPPWRGQGGEAHYDTMSIRRLLELPLASLAAENSHLYLWVPNGMIATGIKVAESFGFVVRNTITWIKNKPGRPTRYLQSNTEILLFCTRGDAPVKTRGQQTVIFAPVGVHSQKPDEQYAIISRLSEPPFVELFARTPAHSPEWLAWGMELEQADLTIPGFPIPADFTQEAA